MTERYFYAHGFPLRKVPFGAKVKVVRFYPRRKALIEYNEEKIITMTTLLRKRMPR